MTKIANNTIVNYIKQKVVRTQSLNRAHCTDRNNVNKMANED